MRSARSLERPYDAWKAGGPRDPLGDPNPFEAPRSTTFDCHGCGHRTPWAKLQWCDGDSLCPECQEGRGWQRCSGCRGLFPHAEWTRVEGHVVCLERCAPEGGDGAA